jgi:alkanesulfonate monooxygenase SsuD/methylene tetrahydromethanopterin reductase-like flavin-dependent oxidoreductase (luciferase family)
LAHPAAIASRRKSAPRERRWPVGLIQNGLRAASGEKAHQKVGLFINTQVPGGFNVAECIPEMVAQVRAARDARFASLWFPHHWLTHPMQMLQITPVMGYVAAHAQGMTIGPNILILPPLNPMHVPEEAATLDVLTGGNCVGLGYRQPEFDAFGIPLSERAPRFNEAIGLMRRLWTEERVRCSGSARFPPRRLPPKAS